MGIKKILILVCISLVLGCKKEQKVNYYFKEGFYGLFLMPDEGLPPHTNQTVYYYYIKGNEIFPAEYTGTYKDTFCLTNPAGIFIPGVDSSYIPRLRISKEYSFVCNFIDQEYGGDTFVLFPSKLTPIKGYLSNNITGRYRMQLPKSVAGKVQCGTFEMGAFWVR